MSSSNRYTFSSLHILSPTILSSNQRHSQRQPPSELEINGNLTVKTKFISKRKLRLLAKNKVQSARNKELLADNDQGFKRSQIEPQAPRVSQEAVDQRFEIFLAECVDEICCPICKAGVLEGASTGCGHTFCLECIQTSLLVGSRCPMCRSPLFENEELVVGFSKPVQDIIDAVNKKQVHNETNPQLQHYLLWRSQRFPTQQPFLGTGLPLDVLTSQGQWRQAEVLETYPQPNNTHEVLVRYLQPTTESDTEVVPYPSLRVAPHGFYTLRFAKASTMMHPARQSQGPPSQQGIQQTRESEEISDSEMSFSGLSFLQGSPLLEEIEASSYEARNFILVPGRVEEEIVRPSYIVMVESEQILSIEQEGIQHHSRRC